VLLETETDTERRENLLAARFRDTEREFAEVGLTPLCVYRLQKPRIVLLICSVGGVWCLAILCLSGESRHATGCLDIRLKFSLYYIRYLNIN
jgi:TATA-box binding protein (TBP) (component of TFIID and TFIIIB)